jgi:hypothetical protein
MERGKERRGEERGEQSLEDKWNKVVFRTVKNYRY